MVWDFTNLGSTAEVLISIGNIDDAPMLAQLVFNEPFMSADYLSDIYSPGDLPEISEMELDLPIEAGGSITTIKLVEAATILLDYQ